MQTDDIHLKVKEITPNGSIKYGMMKTIQDKPNAHATLACENYMNYPPSSKALQNRFGQLNL